jgi:hypothetical protein
VKKNPELERLWDDPLPNAPRFQRTDLPGTSEPARVYLEHAIAAGTPIASRVRLRMRGEIRIRSWCRFEAEQVIDLRRGMVWSADLRMRALPIRGFDRLLDGQGAMSWKCFDMIPVMTAAGGDITRSAIGRLAAELIWLPSAFLVAGVTWSSPSPGHIRAAMELQGEMVEPKLIIDGTGRLTAVRLWRWGDPDDHGFRFVEFGAMVEEERTFGGYTVPTRLRAGWYPDGDRFTEDGEFFHGFIDEAVYR